MSSIGEFEKEIYVEPLEIPIPKEEPVEHKEPSEEPAKLEPALVNP